MALPFYIMAENDDRELLKIVEDSFSFLESLSGISIPRKVFGSYFCKDDYGSIDWYIKESTDYNPYAKKKQVNAANLFNLFGKEPWQEQNRHYELMVLNNDLFVKNTRFIFGLTCKKIDFNGKLKDDLLCEQIYGRAENKVIRERKPYISGIVQSAYRIKNWYGEEWKPAFKTMILHELGHFYGLAAESNPNMLKPGDRRTKNMLDVWHCNNRDCIMEQVNIAGRLDLLEKTKYLNKHNSKLFCEYDLEALKKNICKLYSSRNGIKILN